MLPSIPFIFTPSSSKITSIYFKMQIKFVCILITAVLAGYTQALPVEGVADAIGGAGISGVIGSVDQAVFGQ
ncbi:hypothetical protein MBANPS3_008849 [Mucor bainieri]